MSAHDHREITPGCYRCDLGLDELNPRFDVHPEVEQADRAATIARNKESK